jgi:FkbM family methyltransferase
MASDDQDRVIETLQWSEASVVKGLTGMVSPIDLTVPYGATGRGFLRKNIFADERRLLGPASRIVVDVGAHHGEEVATYFGMFPGAIVHAIEPTPSSLEILEKDWGHDPRVHIHRCALAEHDGEATLHTYTTSECNALTPYAAGQRSSPLVVGLAPVNVRTTSLDRLCAACGIPHIDLLKLDTQGAELRVLAGAPTLLAERRIRLIALEVAFVPLYEDQANPEHVMMRLREAGYHLYDWYNFSYDNDGQVLFGDALFLPAGATDVPPAPPLGDAVAPSTEALMTENARLRTMIAHLERRVDRYQSKLQEVRQWLKRRRTQNLTEPGAV